MRIGSLLLAVAVLECACQGAPPVTFTGAPGRIEVRIEGQPFTALHYGEDLDKPFFHPFRAASGVLVTRGWPVDPAPGETTDHPHHRGLWWAHGRTNGVDFWTTAKNTGRYRLKSPPAVDRARGSIGLSLAMVAPDGRVLGSLEASYVFSAEGRNRIVDVTIRVLADQGIDLSLGDTKEGVMAFRVADDLTEPKGARLINSEGGVGEKQIWGKRARWVDYSGKIGSEVVGVAMFDHPSNPNFPTYWMARGYGLLAANATGAHEFTGDGKLDGTIVIPAGKSIQFRHRIVIHPGDAEAARVEEMYRRFAAQ